MYMPAAYTHFSVAREAYTAFPPDLQNRIRPFLSAYFFGAQGPDFCFFYKPAARPNLGSYLHRKGGYDAFCVLKMLSRRDPRLFAYALGYVSHYAADIAFHPFIYALSGRSKLHHTRLENLFDGYLRARDGKEKTLVAEKYIYRPPDAETRRELFFLYAVIAAQASFPPFIKTEFLRSISLFNATLPLSFSVFSASDKALLSDLLNERKRAWSHPASPQKMENVGAGELYARSVCNTVRLAEIFSEAVEKNSVLSRTFFGKNYLTGK